jgi:diketogulonate reductase-like aldo/keto reductase
LEHYKLNTGLEIPSVGFGTWQTPDGETAVYSVKEALAVGYTHIDTAAAYGNEASVGRAIKESGVKREGIFITSKLRNSMHGYENTVEALEKTLEDLDTDYLDLYLIHWPNPVYFREHWQQTNAETWKAFEEFYRAGRVRAIGVSNFRPHHIEALLKTAVIAPAVNQILLCPGVTQDETAAYCKSNGILPEAYSPLGTGAIFQSPEMQFLAGKYRQSIAQISIRWSLQNGFLPLPKSVSRDRIRENLDVFGFELSAEDVNLIAGLKGYCREALDPDTTNF